MAASGIGRPEEPAVGAVASAYDVDGERRRTSADDERRYRSPFDVVGEALTNVAKHAQAASVEVDFGVDDRHVRIAIRDDGVGGANTGSGSDLIDLRDRIEAIAGRMTIASRRGEGTSLLVELPVDGQPGQDSG